MNTRHLTVSGSISLFDRWSQVSEKVAGLRHFLLPWPIDDAITVLAFFTFRICTYSYTEEVMWLVFTCCSVSDVYVYYDSALL